MVKSIPETAFVNHTWSDPDWNPIVAALYRNDIAAIHFGDYPVSFDSKEWDESKDGNTAKNSVDRLNTYKDEGRLLAVSYTGHPDLSGGRYVGTAGPAGLESGSQNTEMLLLVCRYGSDVDVEKAILDKISVPNDATQSQIEARLDDLNDEARDYIRSVINQNGAPDDQSGQYKILKGFYLNDEDVQWVWNQDFPGLWAANKRGTLKGWNKGNQHLYAAYYSAVSSETNIDRVDEVYDVIGENKSSVWALSEGQLEALCGEYIRRKNQDYVEMISAGGSLPHADIFGSIEGSSREILAQVTFNSELGTVNNKLRNLLAYKSEDYDADIWFFGPEEVENQLPKQIAETDLSEVYKPIETVFEEFETGLGPEFVDLLLDIKLTSGSPDV